MWLYQNCFCLVYPSFFEVFVLPVLEALSFGKPVISSNVSSIPEIVGSAGILINPLDDNELFQAMFSIATNHTLRETLQSKASQQAQLFSWESSAQKVLQLYHRANEQRKG